MFGLKKESKDSVRCMQLLNRNVQFNSLYDLPLVLAESSLSSSGCLDFLVASSSAKKYCHVMI